MNFKLNSGMNLAIISAELKITLPNFKIELPKNPITRFEYIQVRKSALIGVSIRIFEKKEIIKLIGVRSVSDGKNNIFRFIAFAFPIPVSKKK